MKNIIITSGGTSEPIDRVRRITNNSSGKLGSIIANFFVNEEKIENIYYVCGTRSIVPIENKKIKIIKIETVDNLKKELKLILENNKIDMVIHSMAVSDYTLDYVTNSDILINKIANKSKDEIDKIIRSNEISIDNKTKISSYSSDLIIKLKPTQKIISFIKEWNKEAILVGFKLMVDVSQKELLSTAIKLLRDNKCDYVVANDLNSISSDKHEALIVDQDENYQFANTNEEIAKILLSILKNGE